MQGHCLCGAIRVTTADRNEVAACHCSMCRRWGGGPLLAVHCGSDLAIEGRESLSVHRSSDWAERAFCRVCGTHVYYHLLPANEFVVNVGMFEGDPGFRFVEEIFVDEQPGFYAFANDTRRLTGAEVIAQYNTG